MAALLVAMLALLVVLVLRDGDDTEVQSVLPSTTATTAASATTTSSETTATSVTSTSESTSASTTTETTTTSATTTASVTSTTSTTVPTALRQAIWPWVTSSTRFDDPVEAATDFAEQYLGFTEPTVGPFLEGDTRSGEVEIQPETDGPSTVIFVRQLTADNSWWIIGAATGNIEITVPDAMDEITSPLQVRGQAVAFEGVVDVELRADGSSTPLVAGPVTGGGTGLAPFEGSFPFEWPDEPGGAVVLRTLSAEDGRVWEAAVVRILFPLTG